MLINDMDFAKARAKARAHDANDSLSRFRSEFHIPTRRQISSSSSAALDDDSAATYLVGNSLGLQPVRTSARIQAHLSAWAAKAVAGHFTALADSPLTPWLDADARAAQMMAPIVGALASEVAVMQTLSANLHLLMCALYEPDMGGRHKVIVEDKAFPSDRFIVESQMRHHGLAPATSLVLLRPDRQTGLLPTSLVLAAISEHAESTAMVVLPGVQYYTGQFLDVAQITAHAHSHGIKAVWDLAHAAGNVPLRLHDWGVDAAAWCGYKYLNGGPGCIGSLFVHEKHHAPRRDGMLAGWWGTDKETRFAMDSDFAPGPGAAVFQLSNPSVICTTALVSSLEVFGEAGGVDALRAKSVPLTAFLYELLRQLEAANTAITAPTPTFSILTPQDASQRGAQLSILLSEGILDSVVKLLEEQGVYVDERRPDVIRVAPAPLYNTYEDCVDFVQAFGYALDRLKQR